MIARVTKGMFQFHACNKPRSKIFHDNTTAETKKMVLWLEFTTGLTSTILLSFQSLDNFSVAFFRVEP